jgi:hypothetical protein
MMAEPLVSSKELWFTTFAGKNERREVEEGKRVIAELMRRFLHPLSNAKKKRNHGKQEFPSADGRRGWDGGMLRGNLRTRAQAPVAKEPPPTRQPRRE